MTRESALAWGQRHGSCEDALAARGALGPEATQADWWRVCPRGHWLLWQWEWLPAEAREATNPAIQRALDRIVARAIRREVRSLRGVRSPEATAWRQWARRWLDGSDRTEAAARTAALTAARTVALTAAWTAALTAARTAADSAAICTITYAAAFAAANAPNRATEQLRQAQDIRCELPEWPGEEERGEHRAHR